MKKSANAALATNRFESTTETLNRTSTVGNIEKAGPKLSLSIYKGIQEPGTKNRSGNMLSKYSPEQVKDVMWLVAAIVIISIIHRFVPNSGAAPHSIVEVVRSTEIFP